jgi:hypothetical protein
MTLASLLQCSSRLAKKAYHHALAVAATQNVLLKKLGLSQDEQLQAVDFEKYICLFDEGLSKWQSQLILELIKCNDVATMEPLEWCDQVPIVVTLGHTLSYGGKHPILQCKSLECPCSW